MMQNDYVFRLARKLSKYTKPDRTNKNRFTKTISREFVFDDGLNQHIVQLINSDKPMMIGRFGSTESRLILNHLEQNNDERLIKKLSRILQGRLNVYYGNDPQYLNELCNNAGFFPNDPLLVERFVNIMLESSEQLDVLGVWNEYEEFIPNIPESVAICKLEELEPWFYDDPWSYALKDKTVLVVHPFAETIKKQYEENRKYLYKNEKVLPDFELKVIKAVQSIAGEKTAFNTWFDALDSMKQEVSETNYDVAIIGCGAYGFPLAAYCKTMGHKAIHMGGVTQLFFGVRGKRWDERENWCKVRGSHWVFASEDERPKNYKIVEGGCYW